MTDFSEISKLDDYQFSKMLITEYGVASVPGTSFYYDNYEEGKRLVRFCFCKSNATLKDAIKKLERLKK